MLKGVFLKNISFIMVSAMLVLGLLAQEIHRNVDLNVNLHLDGVEVIKPWKTIVQHKPYNGEWTVAGDLTGDGHPEIVCAKAFTIKGENFVGSVDVYTLDNKVL